MKQMWRSLIFNNPANVSCFPWHLQSSNFSFSKMSLRCVCKNSYKGFFKTSSKRHCKTFSLRSRRLQDVFARRLLQDVLSASTPIRMFAGKVAGVLFYSAAYNIIQSFCTIFQIKLSVF